MANKLDPNCLVALMCYVYDQRQDDFSHSLDSTSVDPQHGITKKLDILDTLASLSVCSAMSQVVAVSLQLNHRERQIRLVVAENQEVDPRVVPHLNSVWGILQALSNEFAARGGSDMHEQGSARIPKGVALPLRVRLFCEIHRHSLERQIKLEGKWWNTLFDLVKRLFIARGRSLHSVEFDLYQAVTGLKSVLKLARKLHGGQELTPDESKVVYHDSIFANQKARLVLAEQGDHSCEALAQEFNGTLLLTLIPVRKVFAER